ncbi:cell division protein ZapE [Alkalilacustris brevis]|uniref:cell division protein ZapE n=1 Tax=Alkalilacustris brevis TaxID=2026338 RepID=UPI000E0D8B7C|nr:cell division protein ZapE [Alkalilacustris brevis]
MSETLAEIYDRYIAGEKLRRDPAQRAVLESLEPLRRWLEAAPPPSAGNGGVLRRLFARPPEAPPRGLYLWGGVGRGKSMLMDLFHGNVGTAAKRRVHFHAFMQEVHEGINAARKQGVDDALAPVGAAITRDLRLLCLDEMQITDITDAMIVGRLFKMLFEAGVVVVTTSNRPPDDLYKDGLNRAIFLPFIDLIKEQLEVRELRAATDYRQNRDIGDQRYFYPADDVAAEQIAQIWQNLTQGARPDPLRLRIKGREVVVPEFAGGVARAGFWDICGQPLGPADYLALADAVDVLILEDIPRLSRKNFNEARRFVILIDALYEARVTLIASAADTPEQLYLEGAGAFEFERTASRLREMQSAEWGAEE